METRRQMEEGGRKVRVGKKMDAVEFFVAYFPGMLADHVARSCLLYGNAYRGYAVIDRAIRAGLIRAGGCPDTCIPPSSEHVHLYPARDTVVDWRLIGG